MRAIDVHVHPSTENYIRGTSFAPYLRDLVKYFTRGRRVPRLSANLTFMLTDVPFLDRFEAESSVRLRSMEFMFPYDFDPELLGRRIPRAGPAARPIDRARWALPGWGARARINVQGALGVPSGRRRCVPVRDGARREEVSRLVGLRDESISWDQR
ncbi:MAG: hypothetical protein HYX89_03685 [Chloroflexi bacterium]|nr:hypothetical protein [Chloroflexota bacterium]